MKRLLILVSLLMRKITVLISLFAFSLSMTHRHSYWLPRGHRSRPRGEGQLHLRRPLRRRCLPVVNIPPSVYTLAWCDCTSLGSVVLLELIGEVVSTCWLWKIQPAVCFASLLFNIMHCYMYITFYFLWYNTNRSITIKVYLTTIAILDSCKSRKSWKCSQKIFTNLIQPESCIAIYLNIIYKTSEQRTTKH